LTDAAFNQLLDVYLAMRAELLRFLGARLGDKAFAEDLYQELFVRLRQSELPDGIDNPRGFIYRTAYNLANEHARTNRRRGARDAKWIDATIHTVGSEQVHDQPGADEALDAKQRMTAVMAALGELSPKCREVFTQCRVHGLSHREIAERHGISTKMVEKHMTAALKHLTLKFGGGGGKGGETA
jgi:RNA polymerase sigma-70 factor (ECF subfamily)